MSRYVYLRQIVDKLVRFSQKNPFFWKNEEYLDKQLSNIVFENAKSEEERQEKVEELKKLKIDYMLLSTIDNRKKLSQNDIRRLKASGIAEVFDEMIYHEDIAKAQKVGIDAHTLRSIIRDFGNLTNFEREYIDYFLNRGENDYKAEIEKYIGKLGEKLVTRIDLSNPNLVLKEDNYVTFNNINKYEVFYDGSQIKKETGKRIKMLTPRMEQIFRTYYGLDEEKVDDTGKIGEKYGISKQRVIILLNNARERYNSNEPFMEEIEIVEDSKTRRRISRAYLKTQGVFLYDDMPELDPKKYDKIVGLTLYEKQKSEMECNPVKKQIEELKNRVKESVQRSIELGHEEEATMQMKLLHQLTDISKTIEELNISEWYQIDDTEEMEQILAKIYEIETSITPIEELGLNNRLYNNLKRKGIDTLGNLIAKKVNYLEIFGKITAKDIEDILIQKGFETSKNEQYLDVTLQKLIDKLENVYQQLDAKEKEYEREIDKLEELIKDTQIAQMKRELDIQDLLDNMFKEPTDEEGKNKKYLRLAELLKEEKQYAADEIQKSSRTKQQHLENKKSNASEKKASVKGRIFKLSPEER